jgi:hypothetical protein
MSEPCKLVYLLWQRRADRAQVRELLLRDCAPRLLAAGPRQLSLVIADPEATMRSPAPRLVLDPPPICGVINAWVERVEEGAAMEQLLRAAGFRAAGYLVDETVYTDYGENQHGRPRDWPDGQRSPGICQVTLLERPARHTPEVWMRRWHGTMSPVSEAIQPRVRYVRDVVLRALTPGAPAFAGIVEESWPSKRHISNPLLYYGARTPWELPGNLLRILRAVTGFIDLWRVQTTMMGEYWIRTDPSIPKVRRGPYDV